MGGEQHKIKVNTVTNCNGYLLVGNTINLLPVPVSYPVSFQSKCGSLIQMVHVNVKAMLGCVGNTEFNRPHRAYFSYRIV